LCWRHSGFSVNSTVGIGAQDHAARIGLAQYIARAPLSLAKLTCLPREATVRYTSEFNSAIDDSKREWTARDFIADATLFIPPRDGRRPTGAATGNHPRSPPPLPSQNPAAVRHGRS
jgi:hypothetical protein